MCIRDRLLEYYFKKQRNSQAFSCQNFKKLLPDKKKKQAKDVFKGLRDLQKDFEDIYNDPIDVYKRQFYMRLRDCFTIYLMNEAASITYIFYEYG